MDTLSLHDKAFHVVAFVAHYFAKNCYSIDTKAVSEIERVGIEVYIIVENNQTTVDDHC